MQDLKAPVVEKVLGTPRPADLPVGPEIQQFTQWASVLERKKQMIFYGPPGTGKTYSATAFVRWWLDQQGGDPGTFTQVTFHPSYAYEEFVEGFRPSQAAASAGLHLALRDGLFKQVCSAAEADPHRRHVLLIDEINRANVPRVFGELLTLLEADKRATTLRLPTSGTEFSIPANVYVVGTMNTADRSLRTLDAALRRRFAFVELMPDPSLLAGATVNDLPLDDLLEGLNTRLVSHAGRERQVGHSFFMQDGQPLTSAESLGQVVRLEVIPLLQEIAYDDYRKLALYLGADIVNVAEQRLASFVEDDDKLIAALVTEYGGGGVAAE